MKFPIEYRWLKAHKFNLLIPWYFIELDPSDGLRKEYNLETGLDILPFARRYDNDDIAGFRIENGKVQKAVLTVHLTWSSKPEIKGYPRTRESMDLFEWVKYVMLPASQQWMTEDELEYILKHEQK